MSNFERNKWLETFNPCGIQVFDGWTVSNCETVHEGEYCMKRQSFVLASIFIKQEGTNYIYEQEEFCRFVNEHLLGKNIVNIEGETMKVTQRNAESIAQSVIRRANDIVEEVDLCMRLSTHLDEDVYKSLDHDTKEALSELNEKVEKLREHRHGESGDPSSTEALADEITQALEKAIDSGLGEFDSVARLAIYFGLGDRVPQSIMPNIIYPVKEDTLERGNIFTNLRR